MTNNPYLIVLSKNPGKAGYLSFIEESHDLPMEIKRVYWIYDTKEESERGNHFHKNSERIVACLKGEAEVFVENTRGDKFHYILDSPDKAVYLPKLHWIRIKCARHSILIVLSSSLFQDDIVINDYTLFKQYASDHSLFK